MRTKHSFRNVIVGLLSQILIVIIGFVSRKIFIVTLGNELLGVNGLYTSIISMLSLTELGIGTAIVCNLYKPLADKNETKITELVQFFAKTYRIIGLIVLGLGIAVVPFLNVLQKETMDPIFLAVIFLMFLADAVISYFYAHKRSLIFADQQNYLVTLVTTSSTVVAGIAQIIILLLTKDYILYMSIKVILRLIENFAISAIADRKYPFIKTSQKLSIDKETKGNIVSNTKALSLHYLGNYLINGTDNIIISKFLGVVVVGLYSNYYLILSTLTAFLSQFSTGIIASFGNMVAKESSEKSYDVFKKANFLGFVIYNFVAISLLCLLNPFITIWINDKSLLSIPVVAVLAANFYIIGISGVLGSIRASAGVFRPDRYLHLVLAALNLIVSIGLIEVIGIIGVFLGTLLCLLIKEVSVLPSIVYRNILKISVKEYYKKFFVYLAVTVISGAVAMYLCTVVITGSGILRFLLRCIVCIIIPNAAVVILFRKTDEFKYLIDLIGKSLEKLRIKRGKRPE
ncbi:MAG: lipopolysaccharide biosynthesis protein [Christensenellales bacterium]